MVELSFASAHTFLPEPFQGRLAIETKQSLKMNIEIGIDCAQPPFTPRGKVMSQIALGRVREY